MFKVGNRADPNIYRPISVFPLGWKGWYSINFINTSNKLLTDSVRVYRPLFSTEKALLEETNRWIKNIDNSLLNGVIFLDPKKKTLLTSLTIQSYFRNSSFTGSSLWR